MVCRTASAVVPTDVTGDKPAVSVVINAASVIEAVAPRKAFSIQLRSAHQRRAGQFLSNDNHAMTFLRCHCLVGDAQP